MLKQKEKGLGHFVLIFLSPAHHAQPFFFPVAKLPDGRGYQLTRGSDSEPIMPDMLKLVEYYRNDENSFLKLKKCVSPSDPRKSYFLAFSDVILYRLSLRSIRSFLYILLMLLLNLKWLFSQVWFLICYFTFISVDSKIYLCREYASHGSDTDNKKQQKAPVCLVSMVQCHELIGKIRLNHSDFIFILIIISRYFKNVIWYPLISLIWQRWFKMAFIVIDNKHACFTLIFCRWGDFHKVFKSSWEKEPDDTRPQEIVVKQLRSKEFFNFNR